MSFPVIFMSLAEEIADNWEFMEGDWETAVPSLPSCLGADLPNELVQRLSALERPDFSLQPFIQPGLAVTSEV